MNRRSLLALFALTMGCVHAPPTTQAEYAPTRREHGTRMPEAAKPLESGAAVALLEALIIAVRDEDVAQITRCLAQEPIQLGHTNARATTPMRREVAMQRILGARHASGLPQTSSVDAMVDRESLQTLPARAHFPTLPAGVHEDDIVLTFRVRPFAERALLAIAFRGQGMLVIRVTSNRAEIVAL